MIDPFGRRIDYLRLSVTDRCNLRCVYCLPAQGVAGSASQDLLSDAEIARLVGIGASLGISKLRITGGEPLARPGIVALLRAIAVIPGLADISLSTNGVLLSKMAEDLRGAGLARVNVSLDTLRPERFPAIARRRGLENVMHGIHTALKVGFSPVKINVVVMNGVNADEIPDFISLTRRLPVHVRFIELMPIGETGFFNSRRWLPLREIQARCGPLEPLSRAKQPVGCGPAVYFKSPAGLGRVGFISALSCNFCGRCNRLRLTANGRLLPCLASARGLNLRDCLRSGASDAKIAELLRRAVAMKPQRHQMAPEGGRVRESFMCSLGG
ncbi:MAG: cyclic pyranopterin phosphate synthase MoaA [Elusimicrobia bacterium RIFCSPHIGHO2_02_FULL_57_9]|nr:MAG: cyclic pyranopterin phosphate synthase MoaA [Elusimicrobia bacterium RIFCSPHIGHO2_02_FULL_57_9]